MQELRSSYDTKEQLGKGAYGTVYRCTCRNTGRNFAAKIMEKKKLGEKGCAQVAEEVDVQSTLKHRNVTSVKEWFEDDEALVVVLELVTGGELFQRLTQLRHYSEKTVCEIMHNLLSALDYVHEKGIVHRDLKPDNMLLADKQVGMQETSNIKLADFGFATRFKGRNLEQACGTPYYIAPELLDTAVFKTRQYYKAPACDMWSAGVICYLLLCGYPPFRVNASDPGAKHKLFKLIVRGKVVFNKGQAWDHISDEAKDLVLGMLTLDPEKRLSAKQALHHPWFEKEGVFDVHLQDTILELEQFNARQKVKGAFYGVEAACALLFTTACLQRGVKQPNSDVLDQLLCAKEPLTCLDISNSYLGAKGLDAVTSVFSRHPSVTELKMSNTLLSTEQCVALCKALQDRECQSNICKLDLSDNPLTHPAGRAILSMLQTRSTVTEVKLEYTHISPQLLRKISEQCRVNQSRVQSPRS